MLNAGAEQFQEWSFLTFTDPLELDCIPLQVSLLTMELAALRERLAAVERALSSVPPPIDPAG
jgi:hypothetical protein